MTDVAAMGKLGLLECIAAAGTVNLVAEQSGQFASGPARSGYVIDKGQIRSVTGHAMLVDALATAPLLPAHRAHPLAALLPILRHKETTS